MILGDTGQADGPAKAELYPSLALFTGAIVDQNFDAMGGRLERFTSLLKDTAALNERITWPAVGRNMIGLAVEQETALVVRGATIEAIGERRGHVFLKGNGDRTIRWRMLSEADGPVSLIASSAVSPKADSSPPPIAASRKKNPFGLPEPPPGGRPGMVVLHGGGENLDLIDAYPSLAGVPKPKLVHCPAASAEFRPRRGESPADVHHRITDYFFEWLDMQRAGRLADVRFLTTADPLDARRDAFCNPLYSADAVWFSGGDQNELAKLFVDAARPTLFQMKLADVVRRGGVVGGSSAGTAVMAKVMIASGEPAGGLPAKAEFAHGFGILNNCIVEQHFQGDGRGGRIERFTRLLLDHDGELKAMLGEAGPRVDEMIGLAIEERTALLVQENRLRAFGKQNAHVFLKSADGRSVEWHELKPGDAAFIDFGPNGPVLELDDWRVR
jgi:cyanophycinase